MNDQERICAEMWMAGKSAQEIGGYIGISASAVYQWRKRLGLPPQPKIVRNLKPDPTPQEIEKVLGSAASVTLPSDDWKAKQTRESECGMKSNVSDYERSLYRGEIERLKCEIAQLEAKIVELTAMLADGTD